MRHPTLRALGPAIMAAALAGGVLAPVGAFAAGLAPTPVDDTPTVYQNETLLFDVLANDTDPEGDPLHVSSAAPVPEAYGTGGWDPDGTLTFTPAEGFLGTVPALWYRANDGTTSTRAWVTITVLEVNEPPTAVDDTITVMEDTATDVTLAILANDTDPNGDTLGVTAVANATGGQVAVTPGAVTFTPAADACGTGIGSFDYTVSDGELTDDAAVTVDVTCVNDAPVAVADEASGTEDEDIVIAEATLLANDTDVEGDTIAFDAVGDAVHGAVVYATGVITFTPEADYCGTGASFTYTVTDGTATSDLGTVSLDIACVNDAPVAVDDYATVGEGAAPADHDVLANDTDVDGDALTVSDASVDPLAGTVSVVSNMVRYAPAAGFFGEAVITYTVSDGTLTDTGTLTVWVVEDSMAPVPVAPTVAFGTGRVNEKAPLVISWSATDPAKDVKSHEAQTAKSPEVASGVKGYEVQAKVGSGAWTTIYEGPDQSISLKYAFGTDLRWQVRATDNADNVSDWAISGVRKLVAYQGGSPVTFTGTWARKATTAASGTNFRYTTTEGKKARLTFTGLGVLYVAPRVSSGGYARVVVDGVSTRVRLKADSTMHGQIMASRMWDTSASHKIKVINDQGGKRTTFDAFIVLQ